MRFTTRLRDENGGLAPERSGANEGGLIGEPGPGVNPAVTRGAQTGRIRHEPTYADILRHFAANGFDITRFRLWVRKPDQIRRVGKRGP